MSASRISVCTSILRGLLVAVGLTLLGMLLIAAATLFSRISDSSLSLINQLLKIAAIALGTLAAVGRGGSRGFVTGAALALIYMIAGYALYVALGGGAYSTSGMLGEMLLGAAVGGVCGAICANLRPGSGRKRARA